MGIGWRWTIGTIPLFNRNEGNYTISDPNNDDDDNRRSTSHRISRIDSGYPAIGDRIGNRIGISIPISSQGIHG